MKINLIKDKAKVVVKVGTSVLASSSNQLDKARLEQVSTQIAQLKKQGIDVVVVSSGAIACGMQLLGYKNRPLAIVESSTAAAVGQSQLMHEYEQSFRRDNFLTAQILLTSDGLRDRTRYLNARNTILNLLEKGGIIPIINENDAVVTDEIKFGDNDVLSAQVAALIDAKLLIILSDVDGLYDAQGNIIQEISEIDSCIQALAGDTKNQRSVGGMKTKLEAAKITTAAGIPTVIANGRKKDVLQKILEQENLGTWFLPKQDKISGKKRWIAFSCKSCGKIFVDDGAKEAVLKKGCSLLASGISGVEGKFSFGDLVQICDGQGVEIARGLTNYSEEEVLKIKGAKTANIELILGYKSYDEVIHRNNLVIL